MQEKKPSLFGYGTTTKPLAKQGGWNIYDDKFTEPKEDEYGNALLPVDEFDPEKSSFELTSPGILPTHPLIQKAKNLLSEYDYFYENMPKSVWISGTNGKTTTTQMCEFLLKNKGAKAGGNIGTPLASLDAKASLWLLETSSFTLHYTKKAHPNVYVLLPIAQDHLDWHKDFSEYENDKLSPLKRMSEENVAILPAKYKHIQTKARCIFYESEEDLARFLSIKLESISIKTPFLLDALLALAVEFVLFGDVSLGKINSFKIDAHKMEELLDAKERLWVNDTKGTNIDATKAAVKRYEHKPIHLILGGVDKGLEMDEFFEFLKGFDVKVYSIGQTANKIKSYADKTGFYCLVCKEMKKAVGEIDKVLSQEEVALLSPATSSFDQFSSYKERGEVFVKLVKEI